jgi:hypothetical protein
MKGRANALMTSASLFEWAWGGLMKSPHCRKSADIRSELCEALFDEVIEQRDKTG